jgi:hypothetical protein
MTTRWKITIFLGLAIFLTSCAPPYTPAPKAGTIARLKNVHRAIQVLEEANRATIGEQLRGIPGDATLQRKWELLLLDDAGTLEMEAKDIREFLCCDGYGNLFNVDFTTNVVAHRASPGLTNTACDVVVWSSGRNGTNEFGNGDDVVWLPPTPNK